MEIFDPNKFEKMRRKEGLNNPEDIWDTGIFDGVRDEIERARPNIKEDIKEKNLSPEMSVLLDKVVDFCDDLSGAFKERFLSLLEEYMDKNKVLSPKIVDYLLGKNFELPVFTIAHGKNAETLLEEYDLNGNIENEDFVLVFQLPKPLAQFWWKGGVDSWGSQGEDVGGTVIEWGHFYRELMRIVWERQGFYENEKKLSFSRVNYLGEHDPQKYYYVWRVSNIKN